MFFIIVHVHIVSLLLAGGVLIYRGARVLEPERRCAATVSSINCFGDLVTHWSPWSTLEFKVSVRSLSLICTSPS